MPQSSEVTYFTASFRHEWVVCLFTGFRQSQPVTRPHQASSRAKLFRRKTLAFMTYENLMGWDKMILTIKKTMVHGVYGQHFGMFEYK
jgi:hypothetical protein